MEANTLNESLPVLNDTVDGLIASLMFIVIDVVTGTPVTPFAGTKDVTDGFVTSGELDARVVNVLVKVATGLPLKSVSPLTVTEYSVDVERGLDGVSVTVVLVN